jgi:hypothetical protein
VNQVRQHQESTEHIASSDRAIGLGSPHERLQVIDEDLGKSGAGGVDRHGFQKLIAEIGLGNAGLWMLRVWVAHEGEARELQSHLDTPFILTRDLALTQRDESRASSDPAGLLRPETVELIADGGQLQPRQHLGQAVGDGMHQKPPPSSASYSPSDRSNPGGKLMADSAGSPGRAQLGLNPGQPLEVRGVLPATAHVGWTAACWLP